MAQSISLTAVDEKIPKPINSSQETDGTKQGFLGKHNIKIFLLISIILNIILVSTIVFFTVPRSSHYGCQDGWIGFQNNCYYFSKQEADWNSSRYNCSIKHADLTVINTKEEMKFLRQHKCTSDHWIGLLMTENQTGKWINKIAFNKSFIVRGNEKCAYLSDDGVATARCYAERKWICSRKKDTRATES
ncbi:C-type lectin domain family 2 member B isoform X2 [Rousettus aegyptiacus]|uniref:C-type lectin domain family 2 member B isoform X2 n=1 Tax=Rousettus aegyptiacus TaxID=9407 RepID=UPI00168CD8DA|nr:C-type lectin domain family 2 member B isoform X2 [Rousettus aegyptiacus]XP_036092968.1 C-type lectin domain family 2 member B isoform X2 [Rousettus aegyptiacus]